MESDRKIMIIDVRIYECRYVCIIVRHVFLLTCWELLAVVVSCSLYMMTAYCVLKTSNSFILMSNTKKRQREKCKTTNRKMMNISYSNEIWVLHTYTHTRMCSRRATKILMFIFLSFCHSFIDTFIFYLKNFHFPMMPI